MIQHARDLNLSVMLHDLGVFPLDRPFYFNQRFLRGSISRNVIIIWATKPSPKHQRTTNHNNEKRKLTQSLIGMVQISTKLIERVLKSDITNYIWSSEWMCAYFTEIKLTTQINKWYLSESSLTKRVTRRFFWREEVACTGSKTLDDQKWRRKKKWTKSETRSNNGVPGNGRSISNSVEWGILANSWLCPLFRMYV